MGLKQHHCAHRGWERPDWTRAMPVRIPPADHTDLRQAPPTTDPSLRQHNGLTCLQTRRCPQEASTPPVCLQPTQPVAAISTFASQNQLQPWEHLWSPVWRGTVMFSLQSVFTTARPPLSSCFTIGPSRDSFSIRSLTSCREMRTTGGGQCGEKQAELEG